MTSRLSSVRLAAALALAAGLATVAHADDTAALAAAAKEPGAVVSASGVVFKSIKEGTGASPKATDVVQVHYRGTFVDGKEFDASAKHGGPASFPLNRVIPCWTEGVQKLKVGGKAKLTCPSALAYGPAGAGGGEIPPNSTLVFEVELLGIGR
jgi:FKBP-type peptidyl-prolyl cis-trans isomerase FkpA